MKFVSFLAALLWLFTSTYSVAGAANIMAGQENCHEMQEASMSMHHEGMGHERMGHERMGHDESTKSDHEPTSSHDCDDTCCDGACLCTASCSSITAMTPSSFKVKTNSYALTTFINPEQGLPDPPLYLLDPPPRSVA